MSAIDGGFSTPSHISIGDPYNDMTTAKSNPLKGKRQFLTNNAKKGQTGSNWGAGPRNFDGLAGSYQEAYKDESQYRLQNTKKNLKPSGFTYSNSAKNMASPGDYNGSFAEPYPHMSDGCHDKKTTQKIETFRKRNFITSPSKRGTYGYTGTLINKEFNALAADYGSQRKEQLKDAAYHREKLGDRRAFKPSSTACGDFNQKNSDDIPPPRPDPEESMTPKQRVEAKKSDIKQWKPSHVGKSGKTGAFDSFPEQQAEPYDESIVNRAMLPNRRNPVAIATKGLSESIRERKAFRPSNGTKSKLTKGTCLMGITKHHV